MFENIGKNMFSLFYPKKYIFDNVPISSAAYVKSEDESIERVLEKVRSIDEKRHVRELHVLAELTNQEE